MRLNDDIQQCVADSKAKGKAAFTIIGVGALPSVRANLLYFPDHGGFLLILCRFDQEKLDPEDAEATAELFATEAFGETGVVTFSKEEQGAPPGGKLLWHRVFTITAVPS